MTTLPTTTLETATSLTSHTPSVSPDLLRLLRALRLGPLALTLPERLALARAEHLDYAQRMTWM